MRRRGGTRDSYASVVTSEDEEEMLRHGFSSVTASEDEVEDTESDYRSPDEGYTSQEGTLRAKRIAMRKSSEQGKKLGVTLDGLRVFQLPDTPSHFESMFLRWYSIPSIVAWVGVFFSLFVFVYFREYPFMILSVAIFWRVCYNIGAGILLKRQSEEGIITAWICKLRKQPFSFSNSLWSSLLRSTMPDKREVLNDSTLPPSFAAWIVFRCFANVVETNDVVAFTLTAIQYGLVERAKTEHSLLFNTMSPVGDIVGLILICLSLYSKLEARRTAGDYAWYWGDFFFLRTGQVELSFDGVFELFPHPMYTVGYGWTYGCAILARSFSVLACGMAFHLSQLLFLTLVEVPHVEKLYGPTHPYTGRIHQEDQQPSPVSPKLVDDIAMEQVPEENNENGEEDTRGTKSLPSSVLTENQISQDEAEREGAEESSRQAWQDSFAEFTPATRHNVFVIKNFDFFRASDVNLVLSLFFFVVSMLLGSFPGGPLDDDAFFILQAVFWHVVSSFIKSVILVQQERNKFWTRHFSRSGRGKQAAFDSWKGLYNMLQSLQMIGFTLCAFRLFSMPNTWMECLRPEYLSQVISGLMLVLISIWSFSSCYAVLGDYGWFYGDFFMPPPNANKKRMGGRSKEFSSPTSASDIPSRKNEGVDPSADLPPCQPTYEGIYRYLNNPDAYLGHLWMYGFSLLCSSPELFMVALLAHAMKIAFLQAVEKPHFRQVYKQHVRKSSTALGRAIRGKVSDIRRNETAMFLANWVKHPIETGALAPSSEFLARAMCDTMYLGDNSVVVELGPGTGPFTKEILRRQSKHKNTTYIAFELNDEFICKLKSLFPEHKEAFLNESAENIVAVLKKRNIQYADTVISGLPWAIFPHSLQEGILDQVVKALKPGGRFCTFAYLQGLVLPAGQNFKTLLDKKFNGHVERSNIVWKNLPPAFVYRCVKSK